MHDPGDQSIEEVIDILSGNPQFEDSSGMGYSSITADIGTIETAFDYLEECDVGEEVS